MNEVFCFMNEVPCLMSEVPCLASEVPCLMREVPHLGFPMLEDLPHNAPCIFTHQLPP